MGDELRDKVAIVTGGASGLGLATTERFVKEGAMVVVADIDPVSGESEALRLGDRASFIKTDVSDGDQVQALIEHAVDHFGGLDIVFNNAGVASAMTRFLHDDLSDFSRVMDVNVLGVMLGSQRGGAPYEGSWRGLDHQLRFDRWDKCRGRAR